MNLVRRLLAAALFVAVLVGGWRFAASNAQPVSVHYLAGETPEIALWAVLLVAFGAGAALVLALASYQVAKLRMLARRYRKTVRGLEAEVHQLRNLPLSTEESAPPVGSGEGVAAPPPSREALERGA